MEGKICFILVLLLGAIACMSALALTFSPTSLIATPGAVPKADPTITPTHTIYLPIVAKNWPPPPPTLDYELTLRGDVSNRIKMHLEASRFGSPLKLIICGYHIPPWWGNPEYYPVIRNVSITNEKGESLPFQRTVFKTPNDWDITFYTKTDYDLFTIETEGASKVIVDYELASSPELWESMGAEPGTFKDAEHIWIGYMGWLLLRPLERPEAMTAKLHLNMSSGWQFTCPLPVQNNEVDMGSLDYMYADNQERYGLGSRWKNLQRMPCIAFDTEKFFFHTRSVCGTMLQDVCAVSRAWARGEQAYSDANKVFRYHSEHIGPLPVWGVVTDIPDMNSNRIEYVRSYQCGPYPFEHGLMGEHFGTGGGVGMCGKHLDQVQQWSCYEFNDEKTYSVSTHGMTRFWLPCLIIVSEHEEWETECWLKAGLGTYYENMALNPIYGEDAIIERRWKPMYRFYKEEFVRDGQEVDDIECCGHSYRCYFRDGLVLFKLDKMLQERSGGQVSIDDLAHQLYLDALEGHRVTHDRTIEILNSFGYGDFTDIVNDYLYGRKILDLDEWLGE